MKPERFTAYAFLCAVMGMMALSFYGAAGRLIDKADTSSASWRKYIDWEALYPFEAGKKKIGEGTASKYLYIKKKLEEYTSSRMPGYYTFIEASGKYKDILNWNMVSVFDYNAVVRLKDGCLASYTPSYDIEGKAELVKNFSDVCAEKGIDFMYINFPSKICVSEDKSISGVLDFSNQTADRFLAELNASGVRYYDFRKALHSNGMNHHKSFFVTDGHWKPETGLWAAGEILKILRDDLSWDVEPEILSPGNFEYVIYRDYFLGDKGRKLTLSRAAPEDFTMIYPKFETLIKFEVPDAEVNAEGDLKVIYNMKRLEAEDLYSREMYGAYSYGGGPLVRFENKLNRNGKRLLMIHDSFSICVMPFAALSIQYLDAVDLRYFTGSLENFIDREKPDAVIIAYLQLNTGREKELYDFR